MNLNKILKNFIDYIKLRKLYKKDKKHHVRDKLKNTECYDCKFLKPDIHSYNNYCKIRKKYVFDDYTTKRCKYCIKKV